MSNREAPRRDKPMAKAPLALGLATVSDPSLPIQGSKKVEDFFYSEMSKVTGNFYLPVTDETVLSRLTRVLGRKL